MLAGIETNVEICRREMNQIFPDEDLMAPSKGHVVMRIGFLTECYINCSPSEKFYEQMDMHIDLHHPSIFAIETACREAVVAHPKFCPNVCEVLPILEKHNKRWQQRLQIFYDVGNGTIKQIATELIEARKQREDEYVAKTQAKLDLIVQVADQHYPDENFSAEDWCKLVELAARCAPVSIFSLTLNGCRSGTRPGLQTI